MAEKLDMKKIILLLLLIVVLVIGGLVVIDFTGQLLGVRLDIPVPVIDKLKASRTKNKLAKAESIYLLEREELGKKEEKIRLMEELVLNRESELKSKENEVNKKHEALLEREKELDRKNAMLEDRDRQYTDRKKNIREQAIKLYGMPPNDAAVLMEKQPEADVIDILREIDAYSEELGSSSTAPYLLKLIKDINADKAANILAKLKYEASGDYSGVDVLEDPNIEVPPAP